MHPDLFAGLACHGDEISGDFGFDVLVEVGDVESEGFGSAVVAGCDP